MSDDDRSRRDDTIMALGTVVLVFLFILTIVVVLS